MVLNLQSVVGKRLMLRMQYWTSHSLVKKIMSLTMGIYQLKQSYSYSVEHCDEEDLYEIYVGKETDDILRVRTQNCHTKSNKYLLWVQYQHNANPAIKAVTGWYCICKNGTRIVGCCAHLGSVL